MHATRQERNPLSVWVARLTWRPFCASTSIAGNPLIQAQLIELLKKIAADDVEP